MFKSEVCRKITCLGKAGERTLVYYLTSDPPTPDVGAVQYGAGISILESGEETDVRCLTTRRDSALKLLDALASNFVTPVSLGDVVSDWLCS